LASLVARSWQYQEPFSLDNRNAVKGKNNLEKQGFRINVS
jgi:hypothetical protein